MSIVVMADDFSGAAELAGIGLSYGLCLPIFLNDNEMAESSNNSPLGDGGVICTDSRSLKKEEALFVTEKVINAVLLLQPLWIYKKTDSVLRGHIVNELKLQMNLMGKQKAFLMPTNPSLGRTISNGKYFVNNILLNETAFANDPEFPIKSSLVKEVLQNEVEVLTLQNALPNEGIVVGEASSIEDYKKWTVKADNSWLLSGAGDFFTALLERNYQQKKLKLVEMLQPHLYICGTAFEERREFIKQLHEQQQCVSYLPDVINDNWLQQASATINTKPKLVIAIDKASESAYELRTKMAVAAKAIIERTGVKEIFIEGGSTAAAVLKEMRVRKLIPVNELSRGVVRMKAGDLFITVKPGSYELPKEIKNVLTDNTDEHR